MKPAVLILILCLAASVLAGIHQMVCEQKHDTTSKCDVALGVPVIMLLAIACGVSGLAVMALSESNK